MNKDEFIDERECLGIDCAWCVNTQCKLSKTKYEEKENDNLVSRQKTYN